MPYPAAHLDGREQHLFILYFQSLKITLSARLFKGYLAVLSRANRLSSNALAERKRAIIFVI